MRTAMDDPTDRPYWESEQAFKDAVASATVTASSRTHLWRLAAIAATIALIAASAINIPVSAIISHDNAATNCELIHQLAGLGQKRAGHEASALEEERAETADFKRKSLDRLGLTETDFNALVAKKEAKTQLGEQEGTERKAVLDRITHHSCG